MIHLLFSCLNLAAYLAFSSGLLFLVRENKNVIRNKDQNRFRIVNILLTYAYTGSVFITVMPASV